MLKTSLVPLLGGAVAVGFAALAIAKRSTRGRVGSDQVPRFALEPLGPSDDVVEALSVPGTTTARSEAEALSTAGAAWPLTPQETLTDLDLDFDDLEDVEVLDVELSIEPFEANEAYDALPPEDLGAEWLSRATEAPLPANRPIDDPSEIPTSSEPDSNPAVSEASEAAAIPPSERSSVRQSPLRQDSGVPGDVWDALERSRR